ncbi:MAG: outer membrane beta-barrel protein [Parachlamydiaceae bacterium]|nr:outer membrane beta-barrel protein [Parachlamydiaceae bacterium]
MKKNISLLLMSFLFFMVANVQAQEECFEDPCYEDSCCFDETRFYVKIFSGANFLQNTEIDDNKSSYQTGYVISGCVGYCWRYGLRLEGEYAYRRNAIKKISFFGQGCSKDGHFQTSSFMGNFLWDLPLSSWGCSFCDIQPFIGAGIGYDFQQMHSSNSRIVFNEKWNHFSFQLMTGLSCPIFCNTEISLEYKFHQGGCHFYNHSVGVGLTYKFGVL